MSLHLGALSNLRFWADSVTIVIDRYSIGLSDGLILSDNISVQLLQAPLIGKSFTDNLNNWNDIVALQVAQAPALGILIGDDLNNWNDSTTLQVQGGVAEEVSIDDSLNNWNDSVAASVVIVHYNVVINDSLNNWLVSFEEYSDNFHFSDSLNNLADAIATYSDIFLRIGDSINNWSDIQTTNQLVLEQVQLGIIDILVFDDLVEIDLRTTAPLIRFAHICWTDEYLKRVEGDGIDEIMREMEHKWERFSLNITNGVGIYDLPDYVISITAVTWKGKALDPLTPSELEAKDPSYRTVPGEPKYYTRYGDGPYKIRLSPIPNELLVAATPEGILGSQISTSFIVSCYRKRSTATNAINIPDYIGRRTIKSYVLEKAYRKEGKCQNLKASLYYKAKYEELISLFKSVEHNYYIGREGISHTGSIGRRKPFARLAEDFTIIP